MLSSLLSFRRPTTKHTPALSEDSPCYLHSNEKIPVFSKHDKFLTTQQVITSLLDPSLDKTSISQAVPFSVACHSVFVVDLSCLDSPMTWVLGRTMDTSSNGAVLRRMAQLHFTERWGYRHTIACTSSLESTMWTNQAEMFKRWSFFSKVRVVNFTQSWLDCLTGPAL